MVASLTGNTMTQAEAKLRELIELYQTLSVDEKFAMGKIFRESTGGKLSPYNSPQPVAVAIIPVMVGKEIKIITGRRSIAPKIGELALPGGFFSPNEHGRDAVVREVKEELGLDLDPLAFRVSHTPLTSPTNNTLIFFTYQTILDESILESISLDNGTEGSGEMSEVVLVSEDAKLAFPYHEQAVKAFYDGV